MGAAIQGADGKPAEQEKSDGRGRRSTEKRGGGRRGGREEDVMFPQHLLLFFFFQNLSSCKQGRRVGGGGVGKRRGRGGASGHGVTSCRGAGQVTGKGFKVTSRDFLPVLSLEFDFVPRFQWWNLTRPFCRAPTGRVLAKSP